MKSDGFFGELEQSSTLHLFLEKTFEQMITLGDIEALRLDRPNSRTPGCNLLQLPSLLPRTRDWRSTQMKANLIR